MYFFAECLKFAISLYIYGRLYSPVCLGVSSFKFSNVFNCLPYELCFSLYRDFYSIAYGILALAIFNYRLTDSFSLVESRKPSPQLPFEIRILLTEERYQYLFVSQRFVQAEVLSIEDLQLSRIIEGARSLGCLQVRDVVLLRRLAEDSNILTLFCSFDRRCSSNFLPTSSLGTFLVRSLSLKGSNTTGSIFQLFLIPI